MKKKANFLTQGDNDIFGLRLEKNNTDRVVLDSTITLSPGAFELRMIITIAEESSAFVPLTGDPLSSAHRILLSVTHGQIRFMTSILNYSLALNTRYDMVFIRDASNNLTVTVNNGTPISMGFNNSVLLIENLGRSQARYFDGLYEYFSLTSSTQNIVFDLNEGSGATVTSESGNETGTITTTQNLAYINSTVWETII